MDSANSTGGSMQSSSCGDEEYDSRAESNISAFLNNNPPPPPPPTAAAATTTSHANVNNHLNPHPSPPQHHHMLDPLSNYLDPIQKPPSSHPNPNSLLNRDMVWSKAARSEPNPADLGGFNQAFLLSQLAGQTRGVVPAAPTTHHSLPPESASRGGGLLSVSAANDQALSNNSSTNTVRNPKKRSRASRRAPTTVLTTDTTNFRAMVQEFTGIPAPPFTSSPFPRTRLDLFGSAASSAIRSASTHLDPPPPPYLLRPFAQKVQVQPFSPSTTSSFPPSSSMMDNLASNNSTNNTNSTPINYQFSSSPTDHLVLLKQHQQQQNLNVNNMHNPFLGFQSNIPQAPPKYPLGNSSVFASKTQPSLEFPPTVDSHLKMGVLEELGLSHAHHVNTNIGALHQNTVPASSDGALSRVNNSNSNNNNMRNPSADWAHRTGTVVDNDGDHGGVLRSLSGAVSYRSDISERVSNGKVNYSASPSDFRVEKGPECAVAARTEGTVESWINCSSD